MTGLFGIWAGNGYASYQNSAINISIINTLNDGSAEISSDTNLETSATNLIDAYTAVKQENETQTQQINDLNNKYSQIQQELETLQALNESLSQKNESLPFAQ